MQKMKFAKAKWLAVMLACLIMVWALLMTAWADVTINILSPAQFSNCNVGDGEKSQTLWSNCVEEYIEWEVSGNVPEGYRIEKKTYESVFYYPTTTSGKYNFTITVKGKTGTDLEGKSCSRAYTLIIEPEGGCKHDNTTYPMEKITGTTATCQQDGRDTYWHCNFCEKDYLAEEGTSASEFWNDMQVVTGKHHTDSNSDGKCDDCGKAMPVFKKVTDNKEIVYGGSYVFVTKIGEQYYVLTEPEYKSYSEGEGAYRYDDIMSAKPVALNSNGTLDYATVATNKAMITRTDFAAVCQDLDNWAAMPRYGLSTILGGHRYTVVGEMGPFNMYTESASKYGNYIVLGADGAKLGSVYGWGESGGKGGGSKYLNAFKATKDDDTKVFFGINEVSDFDYYVNYSDSVLYGYTMDSDTHPVYLYKMVFPGTVGSNSYTVSDGWDTVTKGSATAGGVELSNVAGLTNAVDSDKINAAITEAIGTETVTGELVVTLTGDINVISTDDGTITYSVSPALAVVDNSGNAVGSSVKIDNDSLNGTPITVTLNTDGVVPNQIVHELSDGSKEYYYPEETAKDGQQTFATEQTSEYDENGETFVTFTTTSFSDFRILTTPEVDTTPVPTKTTLTAEAFTFTALSLTYNASDQIAAIKASAVAKDGVGTVTVTVKQNGSAVTEAKNAGEYKVYVSATEGTVYAAGSDIELGTVTIAKAAVSGTPAYTKITTSGKTLADAALTLTGSSITVPGTVKWVDDNGIELADTTVVTANTYYKWLFVPTDTTNYNNLDGTIKLWENTTPEPTKTTLTAAAFTFTAPSLTYNTNDQIAAIKASAVAKDGVGTVTVTVKQNGSAVTETKNAGEHKVYVSATEGTVYAAGSDIELGTVMIAKAVVSGTPAYTKITTSGKTLADAALTLTGSTITVPGTVKWVDDGGIDLADTTVVTANTFYKWLFVPTDTTNYNNLDGTIKLWSKSSGGGGGGGSSSKKNDTTKKDEIKDEVKTEDKVEEKTDSQTFSDVAADSYYAAAVKWAVEKGITTGESAKEFAPNNICTRAQIVTFLYRAAGEPAVSGTANFGDVSANDYYAKAVAWAVEKGITTGINDNTFAPDQTCTRAEAVTFLWRAAGKPEVNGSAAFGDVAAEAWFAAAVKWAEENEITGGIGDGLFGASDECTRAQIVTFLFRSVE